MLYLYSLSSALNKDETIIDNIICVFCLTTRLQAQTHKRLKRWTLTIHLVFHSCFPFFFLSIPPFKDPPDIWLQRVFCTNCYFHVMLVPTLDFNMLPSSPQCADLIQLIGSPTSPPSRHLQLLLFQAKELTVEKFCSLQREPLQYKHQVLYR